MTDRSDRSSLPEPEEDRVHDDEGLHPAGEGLSETPIHPTYEAMAKRNDLARQLENVLAAARVWARADGTPDAQAIANALAELYERVGAPTEEGDAGP